MTHGRPTVFGSARGPGGDRLSRACIGMPAFVARAACAAVTSVVALSMAAMPARSCWGAQRAPRSAPQATGTFTFLDISDTHQTATGSTEPLRSLVAEAANMSPKPAFVIDTGDITESGRSDEYARFKDAISGLAPAGIGFYAAPGNHDVRWSPTGKQGFADQFGKLYRSFDYEGFHFILLDTTVTLEHWGHVDRTELNWLKGDLRRVGPDKPVFLFMHHWIGRDNPSTRPIDNEFDLTDMFAGHNIIAVFTGHGHQDLAWKTDGILTLMPRGLYQGSYYKISVAPLLVSIDRIVKEQPGQPVHIATLPIATKARPSVMRVQWDDPDVPFLERRRPAATLAPRAVTDNPDKEVARYRIDDGAWSPMTKDIRDIWHSQFYTAPIGVGVHSADVRLTTSNAVTYDDELIFEVERSSREPTRRWALNVDNSIQSNPLLAGDTLYVSSLDGRLYALTTDRGKRLWSFATRGQFYASPCLDGGVIYIGSTDHYFYAIDAASGRQKWRVDTGSAVFGTAAVARGVVCVGVNRQILGFSAATGARQWAAAAGSFFQSRAATDGDRFFLGGWDNTLYALNAVSGTVVWADHMGRAFYFSPAVSSPAVQGDRVYVCSNDDTLHAVDARTGAEVWSIHSPPGGDAFGYSSPAATQDAVYCAGLGDHGDVYSIDPRTGRIRWQSETGQTIYDSSVQLAPDGGTMAIMGVRGQVSILDASTGKRAWGYELGPGNIFSTPAYDGHAVFTTTMADDVQAIDGPHLGPVR